MTDDLNVFTENLANYILNKFKILNNTIHK